MTEKRIYQWGTSRRFNSLSDYFKREFGGRVQKVSVNAGFTCPNRDGTKGTGGCIYCDSMAFSPSYCTPQKPVKMQIEQGIEFHRKRYRRADKFLAYFQSFTNTYADRERLEGLYNEALSVSGIKGLVIGTRPDCVDNSVLSLIGDFAKRCYVIVEYGIESCCERTLKEINRGHDFETSADAIKRTAGMGIRTGGHIIFGLPGESRDYMLSQASVLSSLPLDNLKFHQLQIIKNTIMAEQYKKEPGRFSFFSVEEYLDFLVEFVEYLNPRIVIERFAGEVPPGFLERGKRWGFRSEQVLSMFEEKLDERDSWQGKYYKPEV